ncbi:MAG: glutathione S-transferase family protein [Acidobacteriota bacterium]
MRLHYANLSSSSRRVSLTVAHLGVELDHHLVDLRRDRAALAALNPNVKIPVLEDGDFVLWESHAIMQYLCERTPDQRLLPTAARARADVQRWMFWCTAHLSTAVAGLAFERIWKQVLGLGAAEPAQVARHTGVFEQFMKVLDGHLAGRTWLSGEALSLADFSIAATLQYERRAELPVERYAHVRAWQERVHALPAWHRTEPDWATL